MANPDGALGGAYNPRTDYVRTGATDTGGTYNGATFSGASFTGTTTQSGNNLHQVQALTATGTGSGDATAVTIGAPGLVSATGTASGVGIGLPVALAGAVYDIRNINAAATGSVLVYASGSTINGATGTTGVTLSPTGTKAARFFSVTAGAWLISGITTT